MPAASITLDQALDLARTGDVWLFRGRTMADRAIQVATNSPVNHVGMSVVIEDLPPLMWHAELGRSLPDVSAGFPFRGVQLHDLREAILVRTCMASAVMTAPVMSMRSSSTETSETRSSSLPPLPGPRRLRDRGRERGQQVIAGFPAAG